MYENRALAAWRGNRQTIGCWLSLANTHTAEVMGGLGFDWVCLDLQHGLLDYQDLTHMLPAISIGTSTPLVRVPWNEPYEIMKALDVGAQGVIVPMIGNRREAEQAVMACRYPPEGNRSFGPIRAALRSGHDYAAKANGQVACIAMIETAEGIEKVDEIVSTPGLDGVYIGPSDLALALGLAPTGDSDHPLHAETVLRIRDACRARGVAAGIHTSSLEYTRRYLALRFNLVSLGADLSFMARAAGAELATAREGLAQPHGDS